MPGWAIGFLVVLVLLALGWYLSFSAARLDRLHARIEGAWSALDAQLVRRASVTLELATSGLLDPASSVLLASSAHVAREEAGRDEADAEAEAADDREIAESNVSRALRATLGQPGVTAALGGDPQGQLLLQELVAAAQRTQLARRFHNDAVRATLAVRRKRVVRWFRLAGRAPLPQPFEMDDEPPA